MSATNTTGNDVPVRAGRPRLVLASGGHASLGSPEASGRQQEFTLDKDVLTLGSAETQDIRLAGLEPEHGVLRRDEDADDWVYSDVEESAATRVDGIRVEQVGLHHGDRLELGAVTLVFQRDEVADHGRPDGGRQGGEFAGGASAGGGGDASEQT